MSNRRKKIKAFTVVEIILAIGIFTGISTAMLGFATEAVRGQKTLSKKTEAIQILKGVQYSLLSIKDNSWNTIISHTGNGQKYLEYANGSYEIKNGNKTDNGITHYFTIETARRDSNGNIVTSGGTIDYHTRQITMVGTWVDILGITNTKTLTLYVTDWATKRWTQTLDTEFNLGTKDFTYVTKTQDGEVQMESVVYGDWCRPQNTTYSFNLEGQGVANTISAEPGMVYVGTGNNNSGPTFIRTDITHSTPPTAVTNGLYQDSNKVNDAFGLNGYAYLATDTNSREILILSISSAPYQQLGYFDAPGVADATSVVVSGNIGFAAVGSTVYLFDLTAKTGARPQIGGGINIGGTVGYLSVSGNYLYVANSSTSQLKIIDFSVPSSASIVGSATVNGAAGTGVHADGNSAYLSTAVHTSKPEFFIIDISTKSGTRPVTGSADTNGMSPRSVNKVDTGRVIVVGTSGYEYQVFNTDNESSPVLCGQLNIDSGVYDSSGVKLANGDSFSYIVTGDSAGELKVIKGGPGGGNTQGQGYLPTASFTSNVFDTTSTSSGYFTVDWSADIPQGSTLMFQIRTGISPDLSSVQWTGPDGTSGTYFEGTSAIQLPTILSGKRYIQYKAYFTSDSIVTPVLKQISIKYQ